MEREEIELTFAEGHDVPKDYYAKKRESQAERHLSQLEAKKSPAKKNSVPGGASTKSDISPRTTARKLDEDSVGAETWSDMGDDDSGAEERVLIENKSVVPENYGYGADSAIQSWASSPVDKTKSIYMVDFGLSNYMESGTLLSIYLDIKEELCELM